MRLFIGTSASTKPICFSTSHQLSRSLSTSSVSSKDHGNTSYVVPGEGSWTCSTEALMSIKGSEGASLDEKTASILERLETIDSQVNQVGEYLEAHEEFAQALDASVNCFQG